LFIPITTLKFGCQSQRILLSDGPLHTKAHRSPLYLSLTDRSRFRSFDFLSADPVEQPFAPAAGLSRSNTGQLNSFHVALSADATVSHEYRYVWCCIRVQCSFRKSTPRCATWGSARSELLRGLALAPGPSHLGEPSVPHIAFAVNEANTTTSRRGRVYLESIDRLTIKSFIVSIKFA
jgi:hypothetical protein